MTSKQNEEYLCFLARANTKYALKTYHRVIARLNKTLNVFFYPAAARVDHPSLLFLPGIIRKR